MRGGWMRWALVASLCLNVAVAVAVGAALLGGVPHGGGRQAGMPEVGLLARAFDSGERRALFRALRADPDLRREMAAGGGSREAITAILSAEPFRAEALEAALRERGARRLRMAERGISILSATVAQMDDGDRRALADRLEARGR